jgi:hypothetical protein
VGSLWETEQLQGAANGWVLAKPGASLIGIAVQHDNTTCKVLSQCTASVRC